MYQSSDLDSKWVSKLADYYYKTAVNEENHFYAVSKLEINSDYTFLTWLSKKVFEIFFETDHDGQAFDFGRLDSEFLKY